MRQQIERLTAEITQPQNKYLPFILPEGYFLSYYPRQFEDGTIFDNLQYQMARHGLTAKRKDLRPEITHLPYMYCNLLSKEAVSELELAKELLPGHIFMIASRIPARLARTFKDLQCGPVNTPGLTEEDILVAFKGIEEEDPKFGYYNLRHRAYCVVQNAEGVQVYPPASSAPQPPLPFTAPLRLKEAA